MSFFRRHDGCYGFTLVEVLIVISIIAMLIALLLPAIKKAKRQTRYLSCAYQQRQILMALQQYAFEQKQHFPYGLWSSPTVIGAGQDIIEKIQGSRLIDTDLRDGTGDMALSVLSCPSWKKVGLYDGVHWNGPPYWGWWGNTTMGTSLGAVHTTYLYIGGIGYGMGQDSPPAHGNGSGWWHGWIGYDSATWSRYDDPYDAGPAPSMGHRLRHSEAALVTDRMWISDYAHHGKVSHPYRVSDASGWAIAPNHRNGQDETEGGNIAFLDGHIELRYETAIQERVHVYGSQRPYVCY